MFLQPLIRTLPTPKTYKETPSWIRRNNMTWPLKPFHHRSVNRIWTTQPSLSLASNNHRSWTTQSSLSLTKQQPLSIACHLPHQSPSTTATSRLVYTTNYHLPTFDTVLTNSVRPSYQVVNPHFPLPHMQSANLQHLPPSSVPPPAEPLTQCFPSSNHQTFLSVTQPIAAHP